MFLDKTSVQLVGKVNPNTDDESVFENALIFSSEITRNFNAEEYLEQGF